MASFASLLKVNQNKLAALSADLYSLKRESVSFDVSFTASSLIDKYCLVDSGEFSSLALDFAHCQDLMSKLLAAINRLQFCTISQRGSCLERVHEIASDLDFSLHVVGAFV